MDVQKDMQNVNPADQTPVPEHITQADNNNRVRMAGLGMLGLLLLVVGLWVFFVLSNREKADEIISRSNRIRSQESPVDALEQEVSQVEAELSELGTELESDFTVDFSF